MKKVAAALFALVFLGFLLFVLALGGGGTLASRPVAPVATEEKAKEYAVAVSKLGAPWDIVILTDAIHAQAEGKPGIEDMNPVYTALEFLFLDVTVERWTLISSSYDEDTDTWDDTYDWVYSHTDQYEAKGEILGFVGIADRALADITPEGFLALAQAEADRRSSDSVRYSIDFYTNSGFEAVLREHIKLKDEDITQVLELYSSDYLTSWLSAETLAYIDEIKALYGMRQYVEDLDQYINYEGLVFADGSVEVVYFNQLDSRWKNQLYGTDPIGRYACGPTAMSIVISTLTGASYDPVYMAGWAYQNGYWAQGNGSYHSLIPGAAEAFGLPVSGCTAAEPQRILDALADGRLVVALMTVGHFTRSGHYIVLRGVTAEGKILVADPASMERSQRAWDLSIILNESRRGASAGGPFWLIG